MTTIGTQTHTILNMHGLGKLRTIYPGNGAMMGLSLMRFKLGQGLILIRAWAGLRVKLSRGLNKV
eukprot:4821920-Amphidinium_carterae.1